MINRAKMIPSYEIAMAIRRPKKVKILIKIKGVICKALRL
jgi:hypothetical protein